MIQKRAFSELWRKKKENVLSLVQDEGQNGKDEPPLLTRKGDTELSGGKGGEGVTPLRGPRGGGGATATVSRRGRRRGRLLLLGK